MGRRRRSNGRGREGVLRASAARAASAMRRIPETPSALAANLGALPAALYLALAVATSGCLPEAPGLTAQFYLTSTAAQVGATVLALFFAAMTLVLTRPGLGSSERAISHVLRRPQSIFTFGALVVGTLLSLFTTALVPEPGGETILRPVVAASAVLGAVTVGAGVLGAGWWLLTARSLLSAPSLLTSYIAVVPEDWAEQAQQEAARRWAYMEDQARRDRRPPPIMPTDNRRLTLAANDPVAEAIEALSAWVRASGGRPTGLILQGLLEALGTQLRQAGGGLPEMVLPAHLEQLLVAALEADDPRLVQIVVEWISDLHFTWEAAGHTTVRSNHHNWLLPLLGEWTYGRGHDRASQQVYQGVFRAAARRSADGRDAMGIAFGHFVTLLGRFVGHSQAWAAMPLWLEIDMYLRSRALQPLAHDMDRLIEIARVAGHLHLRAFDGRDRWSSQLCEWMTIGLGHAIEAAVQRASRAPDVDEREAERGWALRTANGVVSVLSGQGVQWRNDAPTNLRRQLGLVLGGPAAEPEGS